MSSECMNMSIHKQGDESSILSRLMLSEMTYQHLHHPSNSQSVSITWTFKMNV